jgi:hypothetical protein
MELTYEGDDGSAGGPTSPTHFPWLKMAENQREIVDIDSGVPILVFPRS